MEILFLIIGILYLSLIVWAIQWVVNALRGPRRDD